MLKTLRTRLTVLLLCACLPPLSGCAAPQTMGPRVTTNNPAVAREAQLQRQLAYRQLVESQGRLYSVSFPIMAANAGFCPQTHPLGGVVVWNLATVPEEYRRTAKELYNVGERLSLQIVAPGGPADRAGLRPGDVVLSLNGQDIPPGRRGVGLVQQISKQTGYNPSRITYMRQGRTRATRVTPVRACAYPVVLDPRSDLNAYTNGKAIAVTRGMLRFTENDNELAMVVAHELGHITAGHVNKKQQNAMTGMLGGLALDVLLGSLGVGSGGQMTQMGGNLGVSAYSVQFEQEADYIGMYYTERAGYDTAGISDLWRRMAAETGSAVIDRRRTHPSTPERFVALEQTRAEIEHKKNRGQPLAPNLR